MSSVSDEERREAARERNRRYRERHRERLNAEARSRYQANLEAERARSKARNSDPRTKARVRAWHEENADRLKEVRREYYLANKKALERAAKEWRLANSEKVQSYHRLRRARKAQVESSRYLAEEIVELYGSLCHICGFEIDLAAPRKIGEPGWEVGLHLDHVIPISKGGPDTPENVRPSHGLCNLMKASSA